ncbi:MAG: hypothetical protein BHV89_04470 [Clostridiales bacterium 41_21_two_genomes]|nr:MAG: hypothetical protein BHV89_04470 [Clostridiales bacterium 41_21_two_genomes]
MVVVRIIVKIVLLPVRICLTMIQLVVMFFTWLSATVFHILSGIICITAVLGYGFGQETGTEAVRMLVAGFWLGSGVAGNIQNQIDGVDHWRKE